MGRYWNKHTLRRLRCHLSESLKRTACCIGNCYPLFRPSPGQGPLHKTAAKEGINTPVPKRRNTYIEIHKIFISSYIEIPYSTSLRGLSEMHLISKVQVPSGLVLSRKDIGREKRPRQLARTSTQSERNT